MGVGASSTYHATRHGAPQRRAACAHRSHSHTFFSAPSQLLDSTGGALLWVSLVAVFLPAIYFASLGYWVVVNPRANVKEVGRPPPHRCALLLESTRP